MCQAPPMTTRNITEIRQTLGNLLRGPYEALQARVYGGLAARGFADIRPAHSSVFRTISERGSRVSELAERAQIAKQSMAYLVEDLSKAGYLAIGLDPDDRRAKQVRLTAKGLKVWEALIALSAEAEADMARAIGTAEMKELRVLLTKLSATV